MASPIVTLKISPNEYKQLSIAAEQGQQSVEQINEKKQILDLIDYYMLIRSKGLVLFKERGYDIDFYLQEWK